MTPERTTVVIGAAGTAGRVLVPALERTRPVIAIDPRPMAFQSRRIKVVQSSLADEQLLQQILTEAESIVHLATGGRTWEGLRGVEIDGTRALFRLAASAGIRRVVVMSSNHVTGGYERDLLLGQDRDGRMNEPSMIPRPDSEYAAAKAFVEAYGRYIAETTEVGVSCVRVGTLRAIDSPEHYVDAPEFSYIPGGREGRLRRLRATWLHHDDFVAITSEELGAHERFRLRFGVSDNPGRYWPLGVYKWDSDSSEGARFETDAARSD